MKIQFSQVLLFIGILLISSCKKEIAEYYINPKSAFTLSTEDLFVNQHFTVYNESKGQQFVLFSGSENSNYDSIKTSGAFGIHPDGENKFTLSYTKGGRYTITLVASGIKVNERETVVDIMQKEIVVKDAGKSIVRAWFPDLYFLQMFDRKNAYSLQLISPEVKMNGKYLSVEMQSTFNPMILSSSTYAPIGGPQNLRAKSVIELNTSYFDVQIEGKHYENRTLAVDYSNGKDMFVPKKVTVNSISDGANEYELCFLQIPQFKTFNLGDISGTVLGELTDHKLFYIDLKVPVGTDVTKLAAVFETFQQGETVSSHGQPIKSGDILHLTADALNNKLYSDTLDLYFAQPGYEKIFNIHSKTIITVKKSE